jgi:hypothetical protein
MQVEFGGDRRPCSGG